MQEHEKFGWVRVVGLLVGFGVHQTEQIAVIYDIIVLSIYLYVYMYICIYV